MVTRTGIEPMFAAVRGRRLRPLAQRAIWCTIRDSARAT